MAEQPDLTTQRLVLRLPRAADGARIAELAGDRDVASTTLNIPHPYTADDAHDWIEKTTAAVAAGEAVTCVLCLKGEPAPIGAVGLGISMRHNHAELGYWIGRPWWGQGYGTEAAQALVGHGFSRMGLHRIFAHHMVHNPASGRILVKLGMKCEGTLRHHIRKWDEYVDVTLYGMLAVEYASVTQRLKNTT